MDQQSDAADFSSMVHFISDNATLKAYFHNDHKREIIAQGLKDNLSAWNLFVECFLLIVRFDTGKM